METDFCFTSFVGLLVFLAYQVPRRAGIFHAALPKRAVWIFAQLPLSQTKLILDCPASVDFDLNVGEASLHESLSSPHLLAVAVGHWPITWE